MAEILSGREVSDALLDDLKERCRALKARGVAPALAILRVGEEPSDLAYEAGVMKRAGTIDLQVRRAALPRDASREDLLAAIEALNRDDAIHGVLMFRPLPRALREYEAEIVNALDPRKDVDGMTHLSGAGVYEGNVSLGFAPCTAEACIALTDHYGIDLTGKRATVIGRSLVVGRPLGLMLLHRNATVTLCHTRTRDVAARAREADIVFTAAGALGSLTKDCVRPGQTVIDVSVNWDAKKPNARGGLGATAGDAVFEEVAPIVSAITPVPGGVGAVTSAVLLSHVVQAAERLTGL